MLKHTMEVDGREEDLQLAENEYVEDKKMYQMSLKINACF